MENGMDEYYQQNSQLTQVLCMYEGSLFDAYYSTCCFTTMDGFIIGICSA